MAGGIPLSRQGRWSRAVAPTGGLARSLGWFSVALGTGELLAPRAIAGFLGMPRSAALFRAYGIREIGTGIGILSVADPTAWLWGRVGGDALDLLSVGAGLAGPRKGRVLFALAGLAGITALDILCARGRGAPGHEAEA